MTSNRLRPAINTLMAIMLVALVAANSPNERASAKSSKAKSSKAKSSKAARPDSGFTVHEWGTFTSIAGKDGASLDWQPLNGASDLPEFVYDLNDYDANSGFRHGHNCVKCDTAKIRMETPVIYFYSDHELTASASVYFPKGKITEWYPQARAAGVRTIEWGRFQVMPAEQIAFPAESKPSHYYAARETDAATLRVCGQSEQQYEKFLFYRGIGDFDQPLAITLKENRVIARNASGEEIAPIILFENRGGQVGYHVYESFKRKMTRPSLDRTMDELERDLESMLVRHGLYQKEARAMVNTWRDSWFEEGLRVFYIVPRKITDAILPLSLDPKPDQLERVLVGRIELITTEMEQAIGKKVARLQDSSAPVEEVAAEIKREHGRFAGPVLKGIMERTADAKLRARIERIARAASAQSD